MNNGLRWGFLSAGGIATEVAEDFQRAGLKIQAVGARDLIKANAFADKFNIPNRHQGYEALVNDPEVDVVYISTIHPYHHRETMLALNAGKHVLLEKAFTINGREAQEIQAHAKEKNLFVMEAMWSRFLPSMKAIFEVINSGSLGEIELVIADHTQALAHKPRMTELALGGGALLDLGIYPVSFAHRIFGIPKEITARATLNHDKVDATTSMIFEYEKGQHAVLTTSIMGPGPVNATVVGTLGRIEIDKSFYSQTPFRVFNKAGELLQSYNETFEGRGHRFQGIHVEECIAQGLIESPVMSLRETVEIMQVMDRVKAQIGLKYPTE